MKIDHVRFCVDDAQASRDWFISQLGFRAIAGGEWQQSRIEMVATGSIVFLLCSPLSSQSPLAEFLCLHPAGVCDVAFNVMDLDAVVQRALAQGAQLLAPIQIEEQAHGTLRWATIASFGSLSHTFIERLGHTTFLPRALVPAAIANLPFPNLASAPSREFFTEIDHLVLNVAAGELTSAVNWYQRVLGLQPRQQFAIQTRYSALSSQVMQHPDGHVQIPINQPASPNSQIQEFLDLNRGDGIQHIALRTTQLTRAVAHLRQAGLNLLHIPSTYYDQLRQRIDLPLSPASFAEVEAQQVLVDWQQPDQAVLLQTFTQPIFHQPTFFFELIERQTAQINGHLQMAQGFGEGNFRALFEAIEREQMKRGSLTEPGFAHR